MWLRDNLWWINLVVTATTLAVYVWSWWLWRRLQQRPEFYRVEGWQSRLRLHKALQWFMLGAAGLNLIMVWARW